MLPSAEAANEVFRAVLAEAGEQLSTLTVASGLQHFERFAALPFDVPPGPDSDGVLVEYGTFTFGDERLFHVSLVRQFAIPDEDEYVQFHCDLRFAPTDGLVALGNLHAWWWPSEGPSLVEWFADIRARPDWSGLSSLAPRSVETWVDTT